MSADDGVYGFHTALAEPRAWAELGEASRALGPNAYGAWRSQIGRPRDAVTIVTRWSDGAAASGADAAVRDALPPVRRLESRTMRPTLRPFDADAPRRQGNYAFRQFTLPVPHFQEFLDLCAGAWPGFESSYDSQVIGLWRFDDAPDGMAECLLLTRRPNLAMWERSKLPEGAAEAEVRAKLSRRYDLCDDTDVYTTTLLTAEDARDEARWT